MRRLALIVALNLVAVAIYAFVASQMGLFSHLNETLFTSFDSTTYRDVANWLVGGAPNPIQSQHRPFLYPLLLGVATRVGGDPAIWALNLVCWFGMLNVTAAAVWRLTGRAVMAAIVFLVLATNVSIIVLSFQALTESLTAFLESVWILGLALTALPPTRPRDIVLLLLPISLLTVVKPSYQLELLVALVLLAITIWRMPGGRATAALVVGACCLPVMFQIGLMATANNIVGLSNQGAEELRGYYASQVYAEVNGIPWPDARVEIGRLSNRQVADFLLSHKGTAIGTLIANLHGNLTSASNFVDPAKTPLLASAIVNTNRAYFRLHFLFLFVVAFALWRRRDLRLLLLYLFAAVLTLLPSLIFDQGDRYVDMAVPFWAAAYALAVSDLLPDISETVARWRIKSAQATA